MDSMLRITKALADGNRMRVVLALEKNKELCACQLTEWLGLAAPTVSRHMGILQAAGLVTLRKDSRWVYYRISDAFPPKLKKWLVESAAATRQAGEDADAINAVLACGRNELCRAQKSRRTPRT